MTTSTAPDPSARPTLPQDVVARVPVRSVVLFPHVLVPTTIGRKRSLAALRHAMEGEAPLGIVLQKDAQIDEPGFEALCAVGTGRALQACPQFELM